MTSIAETFFSQELGEMTDDSIRNFSTYVLDNAPKYFVLISASSTGKFHPRQSNQKPGGLVNHTRAVVYFIGILCRGYSIEGKAKDKIVASGCFHDIIKHSQPMQKYSTSYHPKEGADFVYSLYKKYTADGGVVAEEDVVDICRAICHHSGKWTEEKYRKKFPEEYTTPELILHLADLISAGKEVNLEFLEQSSLIG